MATSSGTKSKDVKPRTKVVVRGLPPQISGEQFIETINKYMKDVNFWYFSKGKPSDKNPRNARCYLNFANEAALKAFMEQFSGHVFVTNKGKEQKAIVEYAPYQKIPRAKKRTDSRENTIETDPDYLQFLENVNKEETLLPSAEEQLDRRLAELQATTGSTSEPIIVTPLMEYIRNKRAKGKGGTPGKIAILKRSERAGRRKRNAKEKKAAAVTGTANPAKDKEKKEENKKKKKDRRRDREEKKKKKKEGAEKTSVENSVKTTSDAPAAAAETEGKKVKPPKKDNANPKSEDESKQKGRNGIWQIRKHIEPGTIAIQTREKTGGENTATTATTTATATTDKPPRQNKRREGAAANVAAATNNNNSGNTAASPAGPKKQNNRRRGNNAAPTGTTTTAATATTATTTNNPGNKEGKIKIYAPKQSSQGETGTDKGST